MMNISFHKFNACTIKGIGEIWFILFQAAAVQSVV